MRNLKQLLTDYQMQWMQSISTLSLTPKNTTEYKKNLTELVRLNAKVDLLQSMLINPIPLQQALAELRNVPLDKKTYKRKKLAELSVQSKIELMEELIKNE